MFRKFNLVWDKATWGRLVQKCHIYLLIKEDPSTFKMKCNMEIYYFNHQISFYNYDESSFISKLISIIVRSGNYIFDISKCNNAHYKNIIVFFNHPHLGCFFSRVKIHIPRTIKIACFVCFFFNKAY